MCQLENVIVNLSINARDAMQGKGQLTFEACNIEITDEMVANKYNITPGHYVLLSVTDTGSGIPADIIGKVFEPFFTTKGVGKGTGLGLSMVYGFMKQSKDHITIYSEMGHGTTINLYLPKSEQVQAEKVVPQKTPIVLTGHEKILIVGDEISLRDLISQYLENLGYQIVLAANAAAAIKILNEIKDIDLLFTDVITPGDLKGTELAEQALKIYPNFKVLFTSGYPKNALQGKSPFDLNARNFLPKPYKIHELGTKVRLMLDMK